MANKIYPLYNDSPDFLFIATQSGPLKRITDNFADLTRGLVLLDSAAALAMTLAAPTPGPPVNGGHDGDILQFVVIVTDPEGFDDTTPVNHTVTCPAGVIAGVSSTLTFVSSAGESCSLIAYNGCWWVFAGTAAAS